MSPSLVSGVAPEPLPWIAAAAPAVHGAVSPEDAAVILDFSANGNVVGPSARVAAAIRRVDVSLYPDAWSSALRADIARQHGVDEASIVVGNGSTELVWAIARAYLAAGRRTLVLGPTYGEYAAASAVTGAEVRTAWVAPPGSETDVDAALACLTTSSASLVWLCNPNNPTGAAHPATLASTLAAAAPGALVVVDEAYLPLTDGLATALPLIPEGRVVVVRSLTKDAGLAGLRVGYAVAAPQIAAILRRALPPWSVNSLAQAAALEALRDEPHRARVRAAVAEARAHLIRGLRQLGLAPWPSVANFVLVRVGHAAPLCAALRAHGFAVRDCGSFGLPDCIRIGVRRISDQRRLLAALAETLPRVAHG